MHCLRINGTERRWFESADDAAKFRDEHVEYQGDIVVLCGRCGYYHCSNPGWHVERPWEISAEQVQVN
jgi:hypothetical protein